MVKSLLDTDILSEYLKGYDQIVIGHAARYAQQFRIFTFSSVTVYEIVYGLELKTASIQLKKVLAWCSQNEQVTPASADYLAAAAIKSYGKEARFSCRTSRLSDRRYRRPAWDRWSPATPAISRPFRKPGST